MCLPDDMVGKTIEMIAFEIGADQINSKSSKADRLKMIKEITLSTRVDLSTFKFNRDEANNYDDYFRTFEILQISIEDIKLISFLAKNTN